MVRNRPTLKTVKAETTWSILQADQGTAVQSVDLIKAVNNPTTDIQVGIGSRARWIYLEFNISPETTTSPQIVHWQVVKNPGSALTLQSPALYGTSVRKWILKRGMEMMVRDQGTMIKRIFVVKVPPKMRRMDEDDVFQIRWIATSTQTMNNCGISISSVEI